MDMEKNGSRQPTKHSPYLFMVLFVSFCFYTTWRSWIVLDEAMKPPKLHIGLRAKVGGSSKSSFEYEDT